MAEADCRDRKESLDDLNVQRRMQLRQDLQAKFDFSLCQNAECLPEICNEFVSIYMPSKKGTA